MTVEVNRGECEDFPVGLRVLAVDDDPICLKLLDTLLRKCQYHVTTTSQARMALKMLRENQNRFDLVISDVHMPDMDGFKLLELVGLEMDLPVIMLSANGDPKLVMKGVTHGACDYLVKPIRIEELRNIWQHVIRKKKVDPRDGNKSGMPRQGSMENQGSPLTGNTDTKYNRKRKDEEDESEDNENESEDNGTQKKPRVVWSIELHRKFVGAVNQLGIEKAVPKRILDMMNVEGLTRENVASHLQKYRLYLKRISTVATQQANMAAALGVKDSHFMHMGPLGGFGDFRTLSGARLSNVSLSPFASNGMLGRLNSPPANVSHLRNLTTPSPLIHPTSLPPQDLTNSMSSLGKMNLAFPSSTNQNASLFQGIPLELTQLQQHNNNNKPPASFNNIDNSRIFSNVSTYSDLGPAIGSQIASFNPESFNGTGISGPCDFIESSRIHQNNNNNNNNPLLLTESFSLRDNNCSGGGYYQNDPIGLSSGMALVSCEQRQNYGHGSDNNNNNKNFSSLNSVVSPLGQNSGILNQKMDMLSSGGVIGSGPTLMHENGNGKLEMDLRPRSNEDLFMEQPRFVRQGYDSLDELMNTMIKREQDDIIPSCDFGIDDYAFGQGI